MNRQKTFDSLDRVDQVIAKAVEIVCVILLAAIVIVTSMSVFSRFVIFNPLNFADALSKYLMMWMVFLGSGIAVRAGEHIVVDMFTDKIKGKSKKMLLIVIDILISVFLIIIIYYGFINAWSGKDSHDPFVFGVSMMIPYLSVPVGFSYILFQLNLTTVLSILKVEKQPSS
ncbi:TRAP transporter small permease [Ornithinibacillus salinisoli]|uniref:TRAP transporter small permease n=1 Tax=Ornithinibacillus salinisoli TaxID=1848459 RepID=A0ABW4VY48_9BACI